MMRTFYLVIAAATVSALCTTAAAGPAGRSPGGAQVSSSTSRGSAATRTINPARGIATGAATRASRAASLARRSLLSQGPRPSNRVTQIIRERESSGPGWIGTAFLVSLLSQHDLSASDRRWIESRIDSLRAEERSEEEGIGQQSRMQSLKPSVTMVLTGVDRPLKSGVPAALQLTAAAGKDPAADMQCGVTGSGSTHTTLRRPGVLVITWTPEHPGVYILDCTAGGRHERRLLRVAADNETPP
jgi:hypothetical protein